MQQVRSASHVPWAPLSRVSLPEGGTLSSLSINTEERKEQGRISSWVQQRRGGVGTAWNRAPRAHKLETAPGTNHSPSYVNQKPNKWQQSLKRQREKDGHSQQATFLPGESHGQSTDGLQSLGSQRVGHDLAIKQQQSLGKDVWPGPGSLGLTSKDPGLEKMPTVGWGGVGGTLTRAGMDVYIWLIHVVV